MLGNGTPANDIPGVGVIGKRDLTNGWFAGASLDSYTYDFERPASLLGIRQDPNVEVIDADGSSTVFAALIGREFGASERWRWFWTLGLGIAFPDVADVSGPIDGGGQFDLTFDVGTEYHIMASVGTSWRFAERWSASFAARAEHHVMDIRITDRNSGAETNIDSQSPWGPYLSLNYRF